MARKAAAPTCEPISDAELDAVEAHLRSLTDMADADWASAKYLTIRLSAGKVGGLVN